LAVGKTAAIGKMHKSKNRYVFSEPDLHKADGEAAVTSTSGMIPTRGND